MDRLLAKLVRVTWMAMWGWPIEVLLSDFMRGRRLRVTERNSLKRGTEQNSKYRRIGGLNVKYVIEMYQDG